MRGHPARTFAASAAPARKHAPSSPAPAASRRAGETPAHPGSAPRPARRHSCGALTCGQGCPRTQAPPSAGLRFTPQSSRRRRGLPGCAGVPARTFAAGTAPAGKHARRAPLPGPRSIETCGRDARAPRKRAAPRSPAFVRGADVRAGMPAVPGPAFGGVALPPRRSRRRRGLPGCAGIPARTFAAGAAPAGKHARRAPLPGPRSVETCGRDARAPRKRAAPRSPTFVRGADVRAGMPAHPGPAFGGITLQPPKVRAEGADCLGARASPPARLRQARRRRGSTPAAPRSPAFMRGADVRAGMPAVPGPAFGGITLHPPKFAPKARTAWVRGRLARTFPPGAMLLWKQGLSRPPAPAASRRAGETPAIPGSAPGAPERSASVNLGTRRLRPRAAWCTVAIRCPPDRRGGTP